MQISAKLKKIAFSPVTAVFLFSTFLIFNVNRFAPQGIPADLQERARYYSSANQFAEAERMYEQLLEANPGDLDIHYAYIQNHFNNQSGGDVPENQSSFEARYSAFGNTPETRDIGYFGLGLIAIHSKDYDLALKYFKQVGNQELKYLNETIGIAYLNKGEKLLAEKYLRGEIDLDGDVQGAVGHLGPYYLAERQFDQFSALLDDPDTQQYVNFGMQRKFAYLSADPINYFLLAFIKPYLQITMTSLLTALVICLGWILYLRKMDYSGQIRDGMYFLLILLGAGFACASLFLSDTLGEYSPLNQLKGPVKDLVSCLINIGVVEEVMKFLPAFLVVKLSRRAMEPLQVVIYGSLTALGFATLENALYFNRFGLAIAYHRYLISAVLHVTLTGTACYIWARTRYGRRVHPMIAVLSGLALAAILHGLFDFFLMGYFAKATWASIVLLLIMAREYHYVLLRAMKRSAGFEQLLIETSKLESFGLWVSLAAILLTIAYIYNNFTFSIEYANKELAMLALSSVPAIFGVFGALGEIQLRKKKGILVRWRAGSTFRAVRPY